MNNSGSSHRLPRSNLFENTFQDGLLTRLPPRKVSRNACFILVGACFLRGVTDNRHLDTCATINDFATHQKFCLLKKQALGTVKSVNLLHLDNQGT